MPVVWRRILVAGTFLLFLVWGWSQWNLLEPPSYGDPLEFVWGVRWYSEAITGSHSPFFTDRIFHPEGWHVGTLSYSPYLLLAGGPLYTLASGGLVYNVAVFAALLVAFSGTYLAARRIVGLYPATVAAAGYTFAFPVFFRALAHLNVLGGIAALPWLLWAMWRARDCHFGRRWLLVSGFIWGLAINSSFYFLFVGGLIILFSAAWQRQRPWRVVGSLFLPATVALLFNLPFFVLYWSARRADAVNFVDVSHIAAWGISVNSLILPSLAHPIFGGVARRVYTASINEPALMSLGVVAPLIALASLRWLRQEPRLRVLWLLLIAGAVLGLGPYLKWDERIQNSNLAEPVNSVVWQIGHRVKPTLFPEEAPPPSLRTAVPLPELALLAVAPLWEGVRVPARFAYLALLAIPLLAAFTLTKLQPRWLVLPLTLLWLVEILPPGRGTNEPPLRPHPAFAWLESQPVLPEEGIIDVQYDRMLTEAAVILATDYHGLPTASGIGSQWPAHSNFLNDWYHRQGPASPEFAYLLRRFRVRYLLLHVRSAEERRLQPLLAANPGLATADCFDPEPGPSPWAYPICIYEVLPQSVELDVVLRGGWHNPEEWGVWASSPVATAEWVATESEDTVVNMDAFPFCEALPQTLRMTADGVSLGEATWESCDNKQLQWTIPGELVRVGWNSLTFTFERTTVPAEVTGGTNPDPRALALGFSRLELLRAP